MNVLIGKMDRQIEIQRPIESNIRGELTTTWESIGCYFSEVRFVGASERFRAERDFAAKTCIFKVWFIEGITEKDRVLFDGEIFNITGIRELGFKERLELIGEREEDNG